MNIAKTKTELKEQKNIITTNVSHFDGFGEYIYWVSNKGIIAPAYDIADPFEIHNIRQFKSI